MFTKHMNLHKEDSKVKKTFDQDRKRKDKVKNDKAFRLHSDIKKGDFYKVILHNNECRTGRLVDMTDKEIRFSEYTESDSTVAYEYTHKIEDIASLEPMILSLRKESSNIKNNVVIVTMRTGTTGYGELQKETKDCLVLNNFVFFSDAYIPYDITIKKVLIRDYLKLSVPVSEPIDSEKLEKSFQIDSEVGKKRFGKAKELQSFYASGEAPQKEAISKSHNGKEVWNQFEANEKLFGMKATFDESVYTTVLDKNSKEYKKYAYEAECIARRIDNPTSSNLHMEEERGRISNAGEDEKYGSAFSRHDSRRDSKEKLSDSKEKELQAIDKELKELQAKEKELKELQAKEKELKELQAKEKELKELQAKEKELKELQAKEKELKELQAKEKEPANSDTQEEAADSSSTSESKASTRLTHKKSSSTPTSKSDLPKKQDKPKHAVHPMLNQAGVDLSDMVFSSMRNKTKAEAAQKPPTKPEEKLKTINLASKPEESTTQKETSPAPVRRLNPHARMFDPAKAPRSNFLISPSLAKAIKELSEAWTVYGEINAILWKKPKQAPATAETTSDDKEKLQSSEDKEESAETDASEKKNEAERKDKRERQDKKGMRGYPIQRKDHPNKFARK
ncbi:uncharacterized protein NESG_00782 [Nematocida ausubeli]|uniref:LsmAD domain-containing protein n=1 Tax=Nematocida ausubeli (strain ATCC PRA-371 / ERTm2) TaxID=1913371 RepID=A0A086J3B3_NEMA1|nr:uncharacterized protein NESG_00782 [Nematocida ausubeli]KFG26631.1 hypothetical protein NESG_00782 [Nematocida ausubeli]